MPRLGSSDLDVFPLALGGNVFGWTADESTSHDVLDAYVAGGGNFIDTADGYSAWVPGNTGGDSERVIGSWLAKSGRRDDVVIATKVSQHPEFKGLAGANVAAAARASLERLGTDRIDLYWAHFDDASVPLEETVAAFDQLVKDGLVRYTAVSNYSPERIREWVRIAAENGFAAPVALQPHYNLVAREPYESTLAPVAREAGLGVVPYFALAAGFLTGKYRTKEDFAGAQREGQVSGYFSDAGLAVVDEVAAIAGDHGAELASVALAWLRAKPEVVAPIASARSVEQLPALLASASLDLSADEVARLDAVSAKVPAAA
ncbi:aldo/keto reductase [Schumannella luteola]|uniref:Aryl-alcohol dehydrogenase-like predicted oxidoreductase n=1 Tax=Schumannella luteola TaxID=472059 RepID=A0A852YDS0_9MICO|nr:aldo/keto reductase [Schumannella luteola]NYG97807.1 aryl-alcohol dehydrogenase-like predicted oxidoreductase [Schumannella luteola]TPX02930.1 aldo/keto reductase [Schumannella luteola]